MQTPRFIAEKCCANHDGPRLVKEPIAPTPFVPRPDLVKGRVHPLDFPVRFPARVWHIGDTPVKVVAPRACGHEDARLAVVRNATAINVVVAKRRGLPKIAIGCAIMQSLRAVAYAVTAAVVGALYVAAHYHGGTICDRCGEEESQDTCNWWDGCHHVIASMGTMTLGFAWRIQYVAALEKTRTGRARLG